MTPASAGGVRLPNCFLGGAWRESDKDLFFGPLTAEDVFEEIGPGWKLAHVMFAAGIFQSVGDAKRNGWDRPIPSGFSEFVVGKKRRQIAVLNVVD